MKCLLLAMAIAFGITSLAERSEAVAPNKIVVWDGKGAGKVIFDGSSHNKNGLKCMTCHTKIFSKMGKDLPAADITMKAMHDGKFCGACHDGTKTFSVKDTAGCPKCHKK